jgi:hypothetical protein
MSPAPGPLAPLTRRANHIHSAPKSRTGTTHDRIECSHRFSAWPVNVTPDFSSVAARSGLTRAVAKRRSPANGGSWSGSFSSPSIESSSTTTSFTLPCATSCWNLLYGIAATSW